MFDWYLVNTDSNTIIDQQISHDLISNSGQLYGDTVCVNKDFGITYASNVFTNKHYMNDKQLFQMMVTAPKDSRIGDTLVYRVIVQRTSGQQNCFPVNHNSICFLDINSYVFSSVYNFFVFHKKFY